MQQTRETFECSGGLPSLIQLRSKCLCQGISQRVRVVEKHVETADGLRREHYEGYGVTIAGETSLPQVVQGQKGDETF